MRAPLLLLLILVVMGTAQVTVISSEPGRITLRITTESLNDTVLDGASHLFSPSLGHSVLTQSGVSYPAAQVNLTTNLPQATEISYQGEKSHTITLKAPLATTTSGPRISETQRYAVILSTARQTPLQTINITPIYKMSGNNISYYKEIVVTLSYQVTGMGSSFPQGDYSAMLKKMVLNPQDLPKTRMPLSQSKSRGVTTPSIPHSTPALRFSLHDVVTTGSSAETFLTAKNRLYRITPSDVSALGASLAISSVSLQVASRSLASPFPPELNKLPEGLSAVPLIRLDKNSNGLFDGTDEILFYGEKMGYWQIPSNSNSWEFVFNFFEDQHYYWITTQGGTALTKVVLPTSGTDTLATGLQLLRTKQSNNITKANPVAEKEHADRRWAWRTLTSSMTSLIDTLRVVNVDPASTARLRLNAHFRGDATSTGGNSVTHITGATDSIYASQYNTKWISFPLTTQDVLQLSVTKLSSSQHIDFDSYDLQYRSPLSMAGRSYLHFANDTLASVTYDTVITAPETFITIQKPLQVRGYSLTNIPVEKTYLLRHNPSTQKTDLIDTLSSGGSYLFFDTLSNGNSYHIAAASSILAIPTPELYQHTATTDQSWKILDPKATTNKADYLIVAPQSLLSEAVKLAKHKQTIGQCDFPRVVAVEDVFREFAGGSADPTAIRNMMIYAQDNWAAHKGGKLPDYLVLFGDGHYDYKNIDQKVENLIPPYLEPVNDSYILCAVHQSFFGILTPSAIPSVFTGRIPANNSTEAETYLEKLKMVEDPAVQDLSSWRNRALFASDDDLRDKNGSAQPSTSERSHTFDSDSVAYRVLKVNPATDVRNFPLYEYPLSSANYKPQAQNEYISLLSAGVGFTSYYGHGSHTQMADEILFRSEDIGSLQNKDRYFIFSAFSCSVGLFDKPQEKGLCEVLLFTQDKGAIATVASTRTAYVSTNRELGISFADYLFRMKDTTTTTAPADTQITDASYSVGQALTLAKGNTLEEKKLPYAQLGDPSYRMIHTFIPLTLSLHRTATGPSISTTPEVDTLMRLQTLYVKGKLPSAAASDTFTVRVELQNPARVENNRKDGFQSVAPVTYRLAGTITTSKEVTFVGDSFTVALLIPPNVLDTVAKSGVRAYAWNTKKSLSAAAIVDTGFTFLGFDYSNIDPNDKTGPTISLRRLSTDEDGGIIDTNSAPVVEEKITIDGFDKNSNTVNFDMHFADPSGIDYFSEGPGEGITISIEGIMPPTHIDQNMVTLHNDDYRTVSTRLTINKASVPASGEYPLVITSRDILQNESVERYTLQILSTKDEQYTIGNLFCYPSPARMGGTTQFYFNVPNDGVTDITLKIFTLEGKLVHNMRNISPGDTWDLTDQRGQALPPNVYLYRLYVNRKTRDSSGFSNEEESEVIRSAIKKMVIHPRK